MNTQPCMRRSTPPATRMSPLSCEEAAQYLDDNLAATHAPGILKDVLGR